MRKSIVVSAMVSLLAAGLMCGGCMTAVKETVGAVQGGKGTFTPIQPLAPHKETRPLGGYTRFVLEPFQDDFAGKVPAQLKRDLNAQFLKQLAAKKIPNAPGGKTLLIRGTYLHYEGEGFVGMVLGPLEEVIARVQLVDQKNSKVLGVANCVGRSDDRTTKGIRTKTEGLAKAIVSWIDQRYPKDKRVKD